MRKDPRERASVSSLLHHPFVEHSRKVDVSRLLREIIQSQRATNVADLRHASEEAVAPNPRADETPAKMPLEDVRVLRSGRFDAKLPAIPESGDSGDFPRERPEGGASLLALSLYRRQAAVRESEVPRGSETMGVSSQESLLPSQSSSSQTQSLRVVEGDVCEREEGEEGMREELMRNGSMRDSLRDLSMRDSMRDMSMRDSLRDLSLRDGSMRDLSLRDGSLRDGSLRDGSLRDGSLRDIPLRDGSRSDIPSRDLSMRDSLRDIPLRDGSLRDIPSGDLFLRDSLRDESLQDPPFVSSPHRPPLFDTLPTPRTDSELDDSSSRTSSRRNSLRFDDTPLAHIASPRGFQAKTPQISSRHLAVIPAGNDMLPRPPSITLPAGLFGSPVILTDTLRIPAVPPSVTLPPRGMLTIQPFSLESFLKQRGDLAGIRDPGGSPAGSTGLARNGESTITGDEWTSLADSVRFDRLAGSFRPPRFDGHDRVIAGDAAQRSFLMTQNVGDMGEVSEGEETAAEGFGASRAVEPRESATGDFHRDLRGVWGKCMS